MTATTTQQLRPSRSQEQVKPSDKRMDSCEVKNPHSSIAGVHVRRRAPDATVPRSPSEHEVFRFKY